jgi:xylulokinase
MRSAISAVRPNDIEAIGVTATSPTIVFCDEDGAPILDAVMWDDTRDLDAIRGTGLEPGTLVGRAKWLSDCRPGDFERTRTISEATDWIVRQLTGASVANRPAMEYGVPDRPGYFDAPLYRAIRERLPSEVAPFGSIAGYLAAGAADDLGLPQGIPVVNCASDSTCAGIALGVTEDPVIACIGGSSTIVMAESTVDLAGLNTSLEVYPPGLHSSPNYAVAGSHLSGAVWNWWRCVRGDAIDQDLQEIDDIPAGSDGVIFWNCMQGERDPWHEPLLTGGVLGLLLHHRPAHLTRAVLEGICFATRAVMEQVCLVPGIGNRTTRVTGGLLHIPRFAAMLATVLNQPVEAVTMTSASATGAAWLAAGASGTAFNLQGARGSGIVVQPSERSVAKYDETYERFMESIRRMQLYTAEFARRPDGAADQTPGRTRNT